jgi:hypothetical protein
VQESCKTTNENRRKQVTTNDSKRHAIHLQIQTFAFDIKDFRERLLRVRVSPQIYDIVQQIQRLDSRFFCIV